MEGISLRAIEGFLARSVLSKQQQTVPLGSPHVPPMQPPFTLARPYDTRMPGGDRCERARGKQIPTFSAPAKQSRACIPLTFQSIWLLGVPGLPEEKGFAGHVLARFKIEQAHDCRKQGCLTREEKSLFLPCPERSEAQPTTNSEEFNSA